MPYTKPVAEQYVEAPQRPYFTTSALTLKGTSLPTYPRKEYKNHCEKACTDEAACKAFLFNEYDRMCDLKESIDIMEDNGNRYQTTSIKTFPSLPRDTWINYNFMKPSNIAETSIASLPSNDASTCIPLLQQHKGVAIHYDGLKKKCEVLSKLHKMTPDGDSHTFVRV